MDETFINYLLIFMLGWAIGSAVTRAWLHWTFREILKDLGVSDTQLRTLAERNGIEVKDPETAEMPTVEVKLEQHQGVIYAFRKDTDQFLGQGPDREQLILRLKENLTNVRLIIREEDGAELIKNG